MMPNRQPRALFATNRNLVLHDEFADVLESHRRLVQLHAMCLGEGVDQIGGGHRLRHAIFPAPALHQIVEKQGNHIVGLQECAIRIDHTEAVGIPVCGDANIRLRLPHLSP